jgi:MutS domain V
MTNNNDPQSIYTQRLTELKKKLEQLLKRKKLLGWLRLLSLLVVIVLVWLLWPYGFAIVTPAFVVLSGLFLYCVFLDLKNKEEIETVNRLILINQKELAILQYHFTEEPDGHLFMPATHEYANDLDIFGRASLYQYINRTTSEQGNKLIADWLLHPGTTDDILQRQDACKELSGQLQWRQELQACGIINPVTTATEQKVNEWLQEKNMFINKSYWRVVRYLLPVISLSALGLNIAGILTSSVFYPLILLFWFIASYISKLIMPAYIKLNKIVPELDTLSGSISLIEDISFNSSLLHKIKNKVSNQSYKTSASINELKNILKRLDYRLNPIVFIPLNTFLLWDLQQVIDLEKWKRNNQQNISGWFHALAEMESLSTLATLAFNHPDWYYPGIENHEGNFAMEEGGHPLIPKSKRVNNSFTIQEDSRLNLITGSNMAGKSTFLRSVGVNIVLAMMGAPACAKYLSLSPTKVLSSMRVNDNLEENTSTFYAELKKLKEVIEAINKKEKVFLLLDEILRGTNSADRHTGSKALIRQLVHQNAVGLIATHDLELARLADELPRRIHNYHFDVQVANDELYFDYKLKEGICQSLNASILMKKIGIEL